MFSPPPLPPMRQSIPDAPPPCECCRKRGAAMRCGSCGEFYCDTACQRKGWRDHMPVCNQVIGLATLPAVEHQPTSV